MTQQTTDPKYLAEKVPEITVLFWVVKILTTGMGEAASDFLGNTNLVLAGRGDGRRPAPRDPRHPLHDLHAGLRGRAGGDPGLVVALGADALDEVTAFWAAYILTRPLGASSRTGSASHQA